VLRALASFLAPYVVTSHTDAACAAKPAAKNPRTRRSLIAGILLKDLSIVLGFIVYRI